MGRPVRSAATAKASRRLSFDKVRNRSAMRSLSYASCKPGRKLRSRRHQLAERVWRQLSLDPRQCFIGPFRPKPCKCADRHASRSIGQGQLPARHVLELDRLLSKGHRPATAGCQVDGADRDLGGQAQGICRGGAIETMTSPRCCATASTACSTVGGRLPKRLLTGRI